MTYLKEAVEEAYQGIKNQEGGPFGAVIVDNKGNIITKGHNQVLLTNDPTAHAEIVAIRKACEKLHTKDLSDYTLYSTCEPCPMCLSATIWSNIKKVYYASSRTEAKEIGFKDEDIYDFLSGKNKMLEKIKVEDETCKKLFENYQGERY